MCADAIFDLCLPSISCVVLRDWNIWYKACRMYQVVAIKCTGLSNVLGSYDNIGSVMSFLPRMKAL